MPFLLQQADGQLLLLLHIQPKSSKSRVAGLFDGCLKLAIQAPPVDGRANEEVLRFLAELLALPRRQLSLVSGARGRRKQVAVSGIEVGQLRQRLQPYLNQIMEEK